MLVPNFLKHCRFTITNIVEEQTIYLTHLHILTTLAITLLILRLYLKSTTIYLLDFSCYRPPDHLRVPTESAKEYLENGNKVDRSMIDFLLKLNQRSGIGPDSCVPQAIHDSCPRTTLSHTQEETQMVLFEIVETLLSKNKINPKDIGILVTNCSLFCPTPSLSSMIVNKFGLRSNVRSVSLSGMGCSAGILGVGLAKDLLKVHKNCLALVLSMEAVTPNVYKGKVKAMILANALFRMGGAGILLSNRKQDKWAAKYKLLHFVRTHIGADDEAYKSVYQDVDDQGNVGVALSRALVQKASKALKTNISKLAPLVLPYSEQFLYVVSVLRRKFSTHKNLYVPNFKKAFEHFCIHAGGRAVINVVEEGLKLTKEDSEASRMTLYRFGNTSSSSIWYELSYLEAKGRVKKGDRVWQIAFGSGFKCNSSVWKCIYDGKRRVKNVDSNVWLDRINSYPVDVSSIMYS
ncbi:hypothetical protein Cgig2_011948 [Carnegiea gigantea]|uniref:3-ketoacyl-CoA synthase n=1 Tax=Carnegiea gigantea TaxID=171969 RepID=A0A9Q1GKB9_9CARY|nr:hypothetical protein Cgig2_011948 [Carnegiea gigantea]